MKIKWIRKVQGDNAFELEMELQGGKSVEEQYLSLVGLANYFLLVDSPKESLFSAENIEKWSWNENKKENKDYWWIKPNSYAEKAFLALLKLLDEKFSAGKMRKYVFIGNYAYSRVGNGNLIGRWLKAKIDKSESGEVKLDGFT